MEAKEEAGATPHRPGNFANDRERAREAGRKGGQMSNRSGKNMGNFANNRDRAREAGRKGGSK